MNPMDFLSIFKDIVGIAILPLAYFSWKVNQEFKEGHLERDALGKRVDGLKELIRETQLSNTKEHAQVIATLKELHSELRDSERRNQTEHKELGAKLSDFERENEVQHTILNGGKRLT